MQPALIVGLAVLFTSYFLFAHFYLKRKRGIKRTSRSIFHEDKIWYGLVVQGTIFVGFVFAMMYVYVEMEISELSLAVRLSPIAGLFILQTFFMGLEEWLLHRENERYWYEWSESVLILSAFCLILLMEG
ncbi:putative membrane protein [Planomicrobium stackebrandtii]|uniref:Membrane protein n=1 Tax=Planomicrobium stackebrandtii TaxID=253160 RepID=A0ABU0GVY5_9BACL|nr:DUF4181 domain-containing protein [Planomicrobium stackebrandtii]MDQ0429527.1 putative membrane protein [Planomicrobium stackebrandtii]